MQGIQEINFVTRGDFSSLVHFAQELIQTRSLSGQEKQIVEKCIREAARLDFCDSYFDRMGNFIGKVKVGDGRGKKVVLTGHLDTVNAETSRWAEETKPYAASVKERRLFGRGSSDMKGAFATMFYAAHLLGGLPPEEFGGEIYVVGTVVEELFEGVCFLEALKKIRPDYVIVGEASECRVNVGQRGRGEILIGIYGYGKHASVGRTTINPIEQVAYIIDAFHRWYRSEPVALLGKRNIVPTDIKIPVGGGGGLDGRGGNSTVPNEVELTYDVRTLPGDTEKSIIKLIRDNLKPVIRNGKKKHPSFIEPTIEYASEECATYTGVKIKQNKFAPAWKTGEDEEIVLKSLAGLERIGLPAEIGAYSFCTDGSAVVRYRELFPETPCQIIGFGPSEESQAHTTNESVSLDELQKAYLGYSAIVSELLRKG